MITYEEYKEKCGSGISREIFDLLNTEENFGSALEDHVSAILINDILKGIEEYLKAKSNDEIESVDTASMATGKGKNDRLLQAFKRLGSKFKEVINKYKDESEYVINDRYFEFAPELEEAEYFDKYVRKVIPTGKKTPIYKKEIQKSLRQHKYFYHAVNTNLGQELRKLLSEEKKKLMLNLYEGGKSARTNGTIPFDLNVISFIETLWDWRVVNYEDSSKNLKTLNRSVEDAKSGKG